MRMMSKPMSMHGEGCDCSKCMADGGPVLPGAQDAQASMRKAFKFEKGGEVKGVNKPSGAYGHGEDESLAGFHVRGAKIKPETKDQSISYAKKNHEKTLSEMKEMPNPKLKGLADGGEVDSEDSEIHEMIGPEMMDAIHSKDHKKLMSGIEAMVLHHLSKKGE